MAVQLVVCPLVVDIEQLGLSQSLRFGDQRVVRMSLEDPLRVIGTRTYVIGDDPRQIHWKATARTGTLQMKVREASGHTAMTVFLGLRTVGDRLSLEHDSDLMELAISMAASVVQWGEHRGYATELMAAASLIGLDGATTSPLRVRSSMPVHRSTNPQEPFGDRPQCLHVPLGKGTQHVIAVHEALARLVPNFSMTISDLVAAEADHLQRGCPVIYVGAASELGSQGESLLAQLQRRGHQVTLLLSGEEAFQTSLPCAHIGAADTWKAWWASGSAAKRGSSDDKVTFQSPSVAKRLLRVNSTQHDAQT